MDPTAPGGPLYGAAEQSAALRAEVRAAYDEYLRDTTVEENERDYFDKLTRLDNQLADRGLERGDDIDEELPAGTSETIDQRIFEHGEHDACAVMAYWDQVGYRQSFGRSDDRGMGW